MDNFIAQYEKQIIGHLSGFDRLVLRGTLRALAVKSGMMNYLWNVKVRLKDCGQLFLDKSKQLKEASELFVMLDETSCSEVEFTPLSATLST